jgi:1,4-alpha-glucan branching enzyme
MAASQEHVDPSTPMGANPAPGGATFRVWAPGAHAVHVAVHGPGHPDPAHWRPANENLLVRDTAGYWAGFLPGVGPGSLYRYWTVGAGGEGYKRDPRARELELVGYPDCDCVVRAPQDYPWHDAAFRPPAFHELIIYQLHIGVYHAERDGVDIRSNRVCRFLDVVDRLPYLADLGVNAIQPLPVVEWQGPFSRGYNNTDFYSPEMDYALAPGELAPYVDRVNELLRQRGHGEIRTEQLDSQVNQLKALIDLCHVYGIAVILDVVYNHAGGPFDEQSMRFFDQPANREWWEPDAYFTGGLGWAGGRIFDYSAAEVRAFLIDNARMLIDEFHVDGFRYDEVSVMHDHGGSDFCRDLTSTLRFHAPHAIQIAEYWNWDRATAVLPSPHGLGFDAALTDRLRSAIRGVIARAAAGRDARIELGGLRDALHPPDGFPAAWKAVQHIENHDLVDADRGDPNETLPRIPALANAIDRRDWYARSRSRVATGLLLTAPGIPMLFMGQEFLEDKPWHNDPARDDLLLYWDGLAQPGAMRDFLRFTRELCALRRRLPALQGEGIRAYHAHDDDRVIAFHRWVDGAGHDVVVVASLAESTHWSYRLPFPRTGHWLEVFNSDAYDSLPADGGYNPAAVGNPGITLADGSGEAGMSASATIVIPANALLVFALQ